MGFYLTSLYYNYLRFTSWLIWGPQTDPNKVAPLMSHYGETEDWPDWCRLSDNAPHLVKRSILSSLPAADERKRGTGLVEEVENLRLQTLTHYKCHTAWNHEFIRADFVYATTKKPLIAVWERDLTVTTPKDEKLRFIKIKTAVPCASVDRVGYLTEKEFNHFVKIKDAYKIRTATFDSPGPTYLQVCAVLETHSLMFPVYNLYSTMCYWYADSTFEVLVDMNDGKAKIDYDAASRKGQWTLGFFKATAYNGITRKARVDFTSDKAAAAEAYEKYLVDIQTRLIRKYDKLRKNVPESELGELSEAEQESIKKHGWNVAQFLSMLQNMPTHETLLEASKTRAAQVRAQLEEIQSGRDEAEAAALREIEANTRTKVEAVKAEEEAKRKKEIEELQKVNEEQRKKTDEQRKKEIEELQKANEEQRKKEMELQKLLEEQQKILEEQQKMLEDQRK